MTIQKVHGLMMTKADFYDAIVRNGWYLPPYKSTIITIKFLCEVKTGEVWVPKYHEVRMRACPSPPNKEAIINALKEACNKKGKPVPILAKDAKTAPVAWLLHLLSTLDPDHQFFGKSFKPAAIEKNHFSPP